MNNNLSQNQKTLIENYIKAKDENKPHLMQTVFSELAVLEMDVKTDNISFPSNTSGLDMITDVLIKNFNDTFENIYTFCFLDSIEQTNVITECLWLVGMSTKETGELRVGVGTYLWEFDKDDSLVNKLKITIDNMVTLKSQHTTQIMTWLNQLPYPWCNTTEVKSSKPELAELTFIGNN